LDWTDIGPRIGFAYALDPKTVIRGGWGLMYSYGLEGAMPAREREYAYISSLDNVNPTNYFQGGSPFSNVANVLNKPRATRLGC